LSKSQTKQTAYRSAETGRFVTKQYAKRHPQTTVKERNPVPSPQRKK